MVRKPGKVQTMTYISSKRGPAGEQGEAVMLPRKHWGGVRGRLPSAHCKVTPLLSPPGNGWPKGKRRHWEGCSDLTPPDNYTPFKVTHTGLGPNTSLERNTVPTSLFPQGQENEGPPSTTSDSAGQHQQSQPQRVRRPGSLLPEGAGTSIPPVTMPAQEKGLCPASS